MEVPKNSLACAICQKIFINPAILIKHVEFRHSSEKPSPKSKVGSVPKDKHPIIDDNQDPLKTNPAPFEFEIQDNFDSKSEQNERITPTKKENLDTKIDCEQKLKINNALVPKGEKLLSCEICSKSFSTKQSLKRHIFSVHEFNPVLRQ